MILCSILAHESYYLLVKPTTSDGVPRLSLVTSRDETIFVSLGRSLEGFRSRLGHKPIDLRILILQGYGLVKLL